MCHASGTKLRKPSPLAHSASVPELRRGRPIQPSMWLPFSRSLDGLLDWGGIREEVTLRAVKSVIALHLQPGMKDHN